MKHSGGLSYAANTLVGNNLESVASPAVSRGTGFIDSPGLALVKRDTVDSDRPVAATELVGAKGEQ